MVGSVVLIAFDGARQRGMNSPWFLNVYVTDLLSSLRKSVVGFYIYFVFISCIFFANDASIARLSFAPADFFLNICYDFLWSIWPYVQCLKIFLIQFCLDSSDSVPALSLGTGCFQWVDRIIFSSMAWGGKVFEVDCIVNGTKFVGSVFGIMQKYSTVYEEILWNIINKCS